jgi:penicillin-binding protein 1A
MKRVTGGSLPALAWHEFMVAAHEGVPVKPLPGTWKSTPSNNIVQDEAPTSSAPAAKIAPPAPVGHGVAAAPAPARAVRPAQATDAEVGMAMPSDGGSTASIKRPVPPGDVGGPLKTNNISILDILTGG